MRIGRNKDIEEEMINDQAVTSLGGPDESGTRAGKKSRGRGKNKDGDGEVDLSKLKKKELLEIMLRQGEEIDTLRAQVADLQAQLDERIFKIYKAGSIAEASLQVTKIFEEAEEAAKIYLENIRSKVQ